MDWQRGGTATLDMRTRSRRGRERFAWPERRTGFDRRQRAGSRLDALTRALRDRSVLLLGILLAINVLNLLDLRFTLAALPSGATEANPVLALLFAFSPGLAAVAKVSGLLVVSAAIWFQRRYRLVLETALAALLALSLVLVYQIALAFLLL